MCLYEISRMGISYSLATRLSNEGRDVGERRRMRTSVCSFVCAGGGCTRHHRQAHGFESTFPMGGGGMWRTSGPRWSTRPICDADTFLLAAGVRWLCFALAWRRNPAGIVGFLESFASWARFLPAYAPLLLPPPLRPLILLLLLLLLSLSVCSSPTLICTHLFLLCIPPSSPSVGCNRGCGCSSFGACLSPVPSSHLAMAVWEWLTDAMLWKPYNSVLSDSIEASFQVQQPSLDVCITSPSAPTHSITFQSIPPCQVLLSFIISPLALVLSLKVVSNILWSRVLGLAVRGLRNSHFVCRFWSTFFKGDRKVLRLIT